MDTTYRKVRPYVYVDKYGWCKIKCGYCGDEMDVAQSFFFDENNHEDGCAFAVGVCHTCGASRTYDPYRLGTWHIRSYGDKTMMRINRLKDFTNWNMIKRTLIRSYWFISDKNPDFNGAINLIRNHLLSELTSSKFAAILRMWPHEVIKLDCKKWMKNEY